MKAILLVAVFCLILVTEPFLSAAESTAAVNFEASIIGYSHKNPAHFVFYGKLNNPLEKYLFVLGSWQESGEACFFSPSEFEIPESSIQLVGISGAIRPSHVVDKPESIIPNYHTRPFGANTSYFILRPGGVTHGGQRFTGDDCFASISIPTEAILSKKVGDPSGERNLRISFFIPIFSLEKNGTEMIKIGEAKTSDILLHIDVKGNIEIQEPSKSKDNELKFTEENKSPE